MSGGVKIITEGACVLTSFGKVMKAMNRSPEKKGRVRQRFYLHL